MIIRLENGRVATFEPADEHGFWLILIMEFDGRVWHVRKRFKGHLGERPAGPGC